MCISKITLVGGTTNITPFTAHLEEWGVDVVAHAPHLPCRVPKETEALIVLKDHCSHSLLHAAQKVGERRHIPWIAVEQNWTQAEPILQQHKILPEYEGENTEAPIEEDTKKGNNVSLYLLQSQVVKMRDQLGDAENLILEKDEELGQMGTRVDQLQRWLEEMKDQHLAMPLLNKAQKVTLAVGRLEMERELASFRMMRGRGGGGGCMKGTGEAIALAGAAYGISKESVRQTEMIRRKAPIVFEAMKKGEIPTIAAAIRTAERNQEEQVNTIHRFINQKEKKRSNHQKAHEVSHELTRALG